MHPQRRWLLASNHESTKCRFQTLRKTHLAKEVIVSIMFVSPQGSEQGVLVSKSEFKLCYRWKVYHCIYFWIKHCGMKPRFELFRPLCHDLQQSRHLSLTSLFCDVHLSEKMLKSWETYDSDVLVNLKLVFNWDRLSIPIQLYCLCIGAVTFSKNQVRMNWTWHNWPRPHRG